MSQYWKTFNKRITKLQSLVKKELSKTAFLVSSAGATRKSRDIDHEYYQDSDFFYLTGCEAKDSALLILSDRKKAIFISKKPSPHQILWDGGGTNFQKLADHLAVELIICDNPFVEIKKLLKNTEHLVHQNNVGSLSWNIAKELIELPSYQRSNLPVHFTHSDYFLEKMRLHKDPFEVELIREAINITFEAWRMSLALVFKGAEESHIAASIEYAFKLQDAKVAFASIIATGRNAATLHYKSLQSKLKSKDLLLFDIGAEYGGYCADISRVVPVSGKFDPLQKDLYEIVLQAQKSAIKKIRHGVRIKSVYDTATRALTQGLIDLKVLKGGLSKNLSNKTYLKYFPHGIGHSLGIDVHDIGNLRANNEAVLEAGMVFTVEPGLYFPKKIGKVPSCGVRIEDNVLVTKNGCQVLSNQIPKKISEIEELMQL